LQPAEPRGAGDATIEVEERVVRADDRDPRTAKDLRSTPRRIRSVRRSVFVSLSVVSALLVLPSASAKNFRPGDVRACNSTRCVPILDRSVLPQLTSFYYSGPPPVRVARPALGTPYYELRFRNGYVTGIVAARQLDRFLTYGVHDQRFIRDTWYAVPRRVSAELRRLTDAMRPLRLTRAALAKSR
jgi:hypothetical protein